MKEEILRRITRKQDNLNELDVEGHIWGHKFRLFIEELPDSNHSYIALEKMSLDLSNLVLEHLNSRLKNETFIVPSLNSIAVKAADIKIFIARQKSINGEDLAEEKNKESL